MNNRAINPAIQKLMYEFDPKYAKATPDYHSDFNAIHKAMALIRGNSVREEKFIRILRDIAGRKQNVGPVTTFNLIDATSPELCEAVLRTFDKWEDE